MLPLARSELHRARRDPLARARAVAYGKAVLLCPLLLHHKTQTSVIVIAEDVGVGVLHRVRLHPALHGERLPELRRRGSAVDVAARAVEHEALAHAALAERRVAPHRAVAPEPRTVRHVPLELVFEKQAVGRWCWRVLGS